MRAVLVALLVLLVLVVLLPVGMAEMDPCPACVFGNQGAWGLCFAVLGLLSLAVPTMLSGFRGRPVSPPPLLLASPAEKPPRAS